MSRLIKKPLKYEPLLYNDYFKAPIRTSIFGYLLSLAGLIWIYFLAFPYIYGPILVGMLAGLLFLNFYLFFYDKSTHFSPKFSRGRLSKINLPSLQTHIAEISLDPVLNTLKDPLGIKNVENCNLMLFSNRSNHKIVAVMGLSLKSTALHINSNFENFLRVLYSLRINIPLTFQIDLKNMSVNNHQDNSIYGNRVKNLKLIYINKTYLAVPKTPEHKLTLTERL